MDSATPGAVVTFDECPQCMEDLEFLKSQVRPRYHVGKRSINVVDLFAGCGGLTLGLAEAARREGIATHVRLALDFNRDACDVYQSNFPHARVLNAKAEDLFCGEIGTAVTPTERDMQIDIGHVDILLAGPPCQGHSDLNNYTRRKDPRNGLYLRVVRAAEVLNPLFVVIENVPTATHDTYRVVQTATQKLEDLGYSVGTRVVKLEEVGVPQRRRRHILLASRVGERDPQTILDNLRISCSLHPPRTVRWAIGDLENLETRTALDRPSRLSIENKRRIEWLMVHGKYDLPNELRPKCHQNGHTYHSMYGRLQWDAPAQTITTGFGSMGQGRYVHPSQPRTITPHEAARLQTIPDFFNLGGNKTRGAWAQMIGNAVPPLLMKYLGTELLSIIIPATGG